MALVRSISFPGRQLDGPLQSVDGGERSPSFCPPVDVDDGSVHIIHRSEGDPLNPCSSRSGSTRLCVTSNISSVVMSAFFFAYVDDIYVVCDPEAWALFMHGLRWICGSLVASKAEMVSLRFRGSACWGFFWAILRSCVNIRIPQENCLFSVVLDRIPVLQDLQSAWLLLLHCANIRANHWFRGVPPEDVPTQSCLSRLLGTGLTQYAQDLASLHLSL